MRNEYETWLKNNAPAGRGWSGKVLPAAAAVTATVMVGLSVVMMAGLGLPAGDLPGETLSQSAVPAQSAVQAQAVGPSVAGQAVRYAEALPTVTVVGRRETGDKAARLAPATTAALAARPASGDAAAGVSIAGDNLRQ